MSARIMKSLIPTLLVAAWVPAFSQAAPGDAAVASELDELINTDQIQAASKKVQDASSAPADVVVLRSTELRAMGYRTLGDAVGGVVGFRTNEDHAYQGLAVRGLYVLGDQNTRVLVLLDGHALNSPAETGSSKIGEDFGLPIELIDRIEIVRGPASSLYGNNAFQALINVVSVDAADSRNTPFQAAATVGSGGRSELWLNGGLRLGKVNASIVATGFQRSGSSQTYPELQSESLPSKSDREQAGSAYLRLNSGEWSFAGIVMNRTQRLASAPYGYEAGNTDNFYRNRRLSGEFKWEPRIGNLRWMVRLFGDRNEFQGYYSDGSATDVDKDPDYSFGLEVQGRAQISDRFSLTFGTEQRLHRFSGSYLSATTDGSTYDTKAKYRIGNTYLEGNWQVADSLAIVVGLQGAEWKPSEMSNVANGVETHPELESLQRLTPRLSVIWKPDAADSIKFIYGQGFRFPTIFERYYTDGGESQIANPSLKPEVMSSEQVSWTRKWNPQWRTQCSVSLFQWEKLIVAGENGALTQYLNSDSRITGKSFEGEVAWHAGRTELSGGLGWYKWIQDGESMDNVSHWNGVLKAIHRIDAWSLAGEARYVGGRQNAETGTTVPANWTLRASLRYEALGWWAQLTGEDLTSSQRRDLVGAEYDPITWMEADGRSVTFTAGVRF